MGPSRGCREEGCVKQVKGKGRAHTHPLGTGGEGSLLSTDTKELNSHHLVQCYKMGGGVTIRWGPRRSKRKVNLDFLFCCCFHFFPFFNILQTAKNYNTSQLRWGGRGHQRKQPHGVG